LFACVRVCCALNGPMDGGSSHLRFEETKRRGDSGDGSAPDRLRDYGSPTARQASERVRKTQSKERPPAIDDRHRSPAAVARQASERARQISGDSDVDDPTTQRRQAASKRIASLVNVITNPGAVSATTEDMCDAASLLAESSANGEAEATNALAQVLEQGSPTDACCFAVAALGASGLLSSKRLTSTVHAVMRDPRTQTAIKMQVLKVLTRLEPGIDTAQAANVIAGVLQCVRHQDSGVRIAALRAFGNVALELDPAVLPFLIEAFTDEEPQVRLNAARTVAKLADPGDPVVRKVFLKVLREDDDDDLRAIAAEGLAKVGLSGDAIIIEALVKIVEGDQSRIGRAMSVRQRPAAITALGTLATASDVDAAAALLEVVNDHDAEIRARAAAALAAVLGTGSQVALAALLVCLHDIDPKCRQVAAACLGKSIGEDPAVHRALSQRRVDKDPTVRRYAATSLASVAKVGDHAALRSLCTGLDDPDWAARSATFDALEALSKDDRAGKNDKSKLVMLRQQPVVQVLPKVWEAETQRITRTNTKPERPPRKRTVTASEPRSAIDAADLHLGSGLLLKAGVVLSARS